MRKSTTCTYRYVYIGTYGKTVMYSLTIQLRFSYSLAVRSMQAVSAAEMEKLLNFQKGENHASGSWERDRTVTMATMESVMLIISDDSIWYLLPFNFISVIFQSI